MLTVIKLGGRAIEDAPVLARTASRIAALGGEVIVVHGGGAEITAWQERLGLPVVWNNGLRLTTPEGVRVVAMVLTGIVNKRIVAALVSAGLDAMGLSGEDGGLLAAERKNGGELGEVGSVVSVRSELLRSLLNAGLTPVISPISRGPEGEPLNVNADEAAVAVARAMSARRLHLISDVRGLLVEGQLVPEVTPEEAGRLVGAGVAINGMRVKLDEAVAAAAQGIEVRIGDLSLLTDLQSGTRVLASSAVEVA
ncbi:MAG: acetylglutamate kinase [Gemmatimonadetes bacterium]|nr:acetylglutamate kinase [Gemmatimonadota bacterium]